MTRIRPRVSGAAAASSTGTLGCSGIHSFPDGGKLEPENGPFARVGLHLNRSAVFFHDAITNGESEARPLAAGFRGEERIEDSRHNVARHTGPAVPHLPADPTLPISALQILAGF